MGQPGGGSQSSLSLLLHGPECGPMVTLPKEKGVHEQPHLCRVGEVLSPLDTRFCV